MRRHHGSILLAGIRHFIWRRIDRDRLCHAVHAGAWRRCAQKGAREDAPAHVGADPASERAGRRTRWRGNRPRIAYRASYWAGRAVARRIVSRQKRGRAGADDDRPGLDSRHYVISGHADLGNYGVLATPAQDYARKFPHSGALETLAGVVLWRD